MSYRKVGGLHFIRIGRFGFTWYVARKAPPIRKRMVRELGLSLGL